MGLAVLVLPCVELHAGQLHLFAVPQDGEAGGVILGAHQLIEHIVGHKAAAAVDGQYLVPRFQTRLAAERAVLDGVDDPAGDGLVLRRKQDRHDYKTQQEVHTGTRCHDERPLPDRSLVEGLAGGLGKFLLF